MKTLFKSNRLLFREFTLDDAKGMFGLNADPEVLKYTGDKPFPSIDAAKDFLKNYRYDQNGLGRWAVVLKSSLEFIGWCGLKNNEEDLIDIGYRISKKHWGKGIATEAAEASLQYGFMEKNLKEIVGRTARENIASIRVLEKLGMPYWKTSSCFGIPNALYYRIDREEYLKTRSIQSQHEKP